MTFIGSTMGFIGYFLFAVFFEQVSQFILNYSSWHSTQEISPLYFGLLMVLFALSLVGAIRMWKRHGDGFFIYSITQLAILFIPVLWIDWHALSTVNAIFTAVFISGYAMNLKWMR